MRFARQARIFRGMLDPAAVAGVFLLLLIFLLLNSLIYIPGTLIELPPNGGEAAMVIKRSGEILFDGKTYTAASLEQLRQDLKHSSAPPTVRSEPGAPARTLDQLRDLFQIELPIGTNVSGADGPHVVLAVNFRGQCFFEDQMVSDAQLKTRLREAVAEARRHAKELTLVLYADKETETQVQTHLYQLASEAGVKHVLITEKRGFWDASRKTGR